MPVFYPLPLRVPLMRRGRLLGNMIDHCLPGCFWKFCGDVPSVVLSFLGRKQSLLAVAPVVLVLLPKPI